jgi:hypothetical protein
MPGDDTGGCSGVRVPPPKYRNREASSQDRYLDADGYPVRDRRGISMNDQTRRVSKRVQNPVDHIGVKGLDFPLGKAEPNFANGIDGQIDRDDASDDFIKEKLHSNFRSSNAMTRPQDSSIGRATAVMAFALPGLSVAGFGVGSIACRAPARKIRFVEADQGDLPCPVPRAKIVLFSRNANQAI